MIPIEPTKISIDAIVRRDKKWSLQDELFIDKVISSFRSGLLRIPKGKTLTSLLSELNCDVSRISRKYKGSTCIRRLTFCPCELTEENIRRIEKIETDLMLHQRLIADNYAGQGFVFSTSNDFLKCNNKNVEVLSLLDAQLKINQPHHSVKALNRVFLGNVTKIDNANYNQAENAVEDVEMQTDDGTVHQSCSSSSSSFSSSTSSCSHPCPLIRKRSWSSTNGSDTNSFDSSSTASSSVEDDEGHSGPWTQCGLGLGSRDYRTHPLPALGADHWDEGHTDTDGTAGPTSPTDSIRMCSSIIPPAAAKRILGSTAQTTHKRMRSAGSSMRPPTILSPEELSLWKTIFSEIVDL